MNKFTLPGKIREVNASIVAPQFSGLRLVPLFHNINGEFNGELGKMFAKRWARVREDYKGWFASQQNFKLGKTFQTMIASDIWVIHMLVLDKNGNLDENALAQAVKELSSVVKMEKASVHMSNLLLDVAPKFKDMLVELVVKEGFNLFLYNEPIK